MKLQLLLLDPSLDQLVEGSDVKELIDLPPSLIMLNPCTKIRRIRFVIGVIFAQERRRSRPPQIRDGLNDLHLSAFEFFLWLRLCLGALEGGDMSLELAIEFLQHLLLADQSPILHI